jgi:hypothetical protein
MPKKKCLGSAFPVFDSTFFLSLARFLETNFPLHSLEHFYFTSRNLLRNFFLEKQYFIIWRNRF